MRVRMKTHITGYRDGVEWPQVGGELDLPDPEAADMIANGYAEEVPGDGLDELGVRKLRGLARDAGLDVPKSADKDELVAALRAAQGGTDAPATDDTGDTPTETPGPDGPATDETATAGTDQDT